MEVRSEGDLDFEKFEVMVRSRTVISFQAKACRAVHVKLSEIPRLTEIYSYEVSNPVFVCLLVLYN